MFKNTKQGFSLIEVMILFTLLAVILAASMPILTKKSNPIPKNISHGVYRCIATPNDGVVEELYNANRLIVKNKNLTKCTFNVPTASVYKVEMYGAGAGGTMYAEMKPVLSSDNGVREFTLSDAASYAANPAAHPVNPNKSGYKLTDEDIKKVFSGKYVKKSEYSAKAGDGGDAKISYYSPADAVCRYKPNTSIYNLQELKNFMNEVPTMALPTVYYTESNLMTPLSPDSYTQITNYQFQLDSLCKIAEKYQRNELIIPPNLHNTKDENTCIDNGNKENCFTYKNSLSLSSRGGKGGLGSFLTVSYTLPNPNNVSRYLKTEKFPYTALIGKIYSNYKDEIGRYYGFGIGSCNGNGVCNSNRPESAKKGNSQNENGMDTDGTKYLDFTVGKIAKVTANEDNFKIIQADDGDSVDIRLAWSVPTKFYGTKNQYKTTITEPATGGKGGYIQVEKAKNWEADFNPASLTFLKKDNSWKINNKNSNGENITGEDGNDEIFDSRKISASTSVIPYDIYSNRKIGEFSEPKLKIQSELLEKHYRLGGPGTYGQKRTFKVSSLGKTCTMFVYPGGEPYNYANDLLSGKKTHAQILKDLNNIETKLNTTMTCKDGDEVVFRDSALGGKYDLKLYGNEIVNGKEYVKPFIWDSSIEDNYEHTVSSSANDKDSGIYMPDTSRFTHKYKAFFSKLFVKDILSLDSIYNVSIGGKGTVLIDKCTGPKGKVIIDLYEQSWTQSVTTDKQSSDYGIVKNAESYKDIKKQDNIIDKNGIYDDSRGCYNTNYGPDNEEKLLITGNEYKDKYQVSAGSGGGGAIVITW